jgi:type I restriction enzyme S subunit
MADAHFREDARAHFIERFWEMYLAVALIERGFQLVPGTGTGPEFSFNQGSGHFWVEAVAPGPGTGADRVPDIELGIASKVPTERILLRFANAVVEKRNRYHSALQAGIIGPASGYVLAINSRRIPHAPYGNTLPYYLQALLPIGDLTVMLNRSTREIEDRFYAAREKILKSNTAPVSTQPLLNTDFGFVSAVLHSSVDCVNRPTVLGADFSVLHNPLATQPLAPLTFDWCDQYFYNDGILEKRLAG